MMNKLSDKRNLLDKNYFRTHYNLAVHHWSTVDRTSWPIGARRYAMLKKTIIKYTR
jgi:hypothetical protein